MSVTTPDTAASSASPRHRRPLRLRWGRNLLEITRASLFARIGRVEAYARTRASFDPRRDCWREPGSVEMYGFGLALTVSWAPARSRLG